MLNLSPRARLEAIGAAMVAFLSRPEMIQFERRIAAETECEPAIGKAFLEAGPRHMLRAFAALLRAAALMACADRSNALPSILRRREPSVAHQAAQFR